MRKCPGALDSMAMDVMSMGVKMKSLRKGLKGKILLVK
jgi:hypothetical protein